MGCFWSKNDSSSKEGGGGLGLIPVPAPPTKEAPTKKYKKPKWASETPLTREQLNEMREVFWDTQPAYGGQKVIWDNLKAAAEADMDTARLIIDSAGIIVASKDMSVCYDERGAKYELPNYVLSDPTNLA